MIRQFRFNYVDGLPHKIEPGDFHLFIITEYQRVKFYNFISTNNLTIVYISPQAYNVVHPGDYARNTLFILKGNT